jgi:hypothetical protein
MLMRYHWGLGVGHVYSHGRGAKISTPCTTTTQTFEDADSGDEAVTKPIQYDQVDGSDAEDPELGFDDREDDFPEAEGDPEDEQIRDEEDEELIVAMDDMYGPLEWEPS